MSAGKEYEKEEKKKRDVREYGTINRKNFGNGGGSNRVLLYIGKLYGFFAGYFQQVRRKDMEIKSLVYTTIWAAADGLAIIWLLKMLLELWGMESLIQSLLFMSRGLCG